MPIMSGLHCLKLGLFFGSIPHMGLVIYRDNWNLGETVFNIGGKGGCSIVEGIVFLPEPIYRFSEPKAPSS